MTSIERTAYPRWKSGLTPAEVQRYYQPTEAELVFVDRTGRSEEVRLRLLVLLKTFQRLGYFPPLRSVPPLIIQFLRHAMRLPTSIPFQTHLDPSAHYPALYTFLQVQPYKAGGEQVVRQTLLQLLPTRDDPADLINAVLEALVQQRFALPGFTVLHRLVLHERERYHEALYRQVIDSLSESERTRLDSLLQRSEGEPFTPFHHLRQPPGPARLTEMRVLLERLTWLETLLETRQRLAAFPPVKRQLFAAQAHALETYDLLDLSPHRRYTLLVCLVHQAQAQVRDHLVAMFLKRLNSLHKRALDELELTRQQQRELTEGMIDTLGRIVDSARTLEDDAELGYQVRVLIDSAGGSDALAERYERIAAFHDNNYLLLLPRFYASYRGTLFRLVSALSLHSTTGNVTLLDALVYLQQQERRDEWIQAPLDLSFAPAAWQRVMIRHTDTERWLHRPLLELCAFTLLALALKSGNVCVEHALDYADYRDQLLSWEECQPHLQKHCQELGFPVEAKLFVAQVRQWLTTVAVEVDAATPENTHLSFHPDGRPRLRRTEKLPLPVGFETLRREVLRRLPERSILDILTNLHSWTHFTRHFGPPSGGEVHRENAIGQYLLTVFCYGCNLGPAQMSKHSRLEISPRVLARLSRQHITAEQLEAVRRDIIHCYRRLDLPTYWGKGTSAAADGTQFEIYQHNLLAEYHLRYGKYGGIAYHHVSDTYIALFSHFIACGVYEALYILDGLLKNRSDLQPDILHADTHGQSEIVYGLAFLLGIQLMPRIRRWHQLTFYRPSAKTTYQHLDALFTDTINWRLIETHWQDMMQIIVSIRVGRILPSTLLRKLGTYSRQNRLYQAFRELGRVVRTVFLLRYLASETLRRHIQSATNIVEAYHHLSKWCYFGQQGVITHNDPLEQEKRVKYNDVIACAIILQNAVDLTSVLREMVQEGYSITPEVVARLSPYLTDHIRRFGEYVLDLAQAPPLLDLDTPLFTISRSI